MSDLILDAVRHGIAVVDLGRPLFNGMPQSPNHPAFWHSLPRRHGDSVRAGGGSAANDVIITGTHVGTHIDALAHVSQDGKLHGDIDAAAAGVGGRYMELGVHTIAPMVRRGVLLDIPAVLDMNDGCPPGYEITPDDLSLAEQRAGVTVGESDVVLIRSGWGRRFADGTEAFVGNRSGVPGIGEAGALWVAERHVHAAGADSIAFEHLAPGAGHSSLPAHRVLLVDAGIYLIEAMDLEPLAAIGATEFTFVLVPLNIVGATGSPTRPIAVLSDRGIGQGRPGTEKSEP